MVEADGNVHIESMRMRVLESLEKSSEALTQGVIFTSAIVDLIHGKISNQQTKEYLSNLLEWILDVTTANLGIANEFTDQEVNTELWNQICQSRRILKRIIIATKGDKHRSALENEDTIVTVNTIRSLKDLASKTSNLILSTSREIMQRERSKGVYWYELAVAYEATIVLRSQNKVALAIDLANSCISPKLKIEKSKSRSEQIRGLFSFNRNLLQKMSDVDSSFSAHELLFKLSNRISRNSKSAASCGLNWNEEEVEIPLTMLYNFINVMKSGELQMHKSSVFHLEGLFRVCAYHSYWSNAFSVQPDTKLLESDNVTLNKLMTVYFVEDFFENNFLQKVKSLDICDWLKSVMIAKLNEDLSHLYSDITPSVWLDQKIIDELLPDKDHPKFATIKSSLRNKLNFWEKNLDSPMMIRSEFRDAAIFDMDARAQSLIENSKASISEEMIKFLGDFSGNNPLSGGGQKGSLAMFLNKKSNSPSRHLRHFPQGNLNRAQVAVSMALMQAISRQDDPIFSDLYNQSHKSSKIQYTRGHLKEQESILEFDKKKSKEQNRSLLSRVNKLDQMMFVANALNYIFEVIESEQIDRINLISTRSDEKLRECSTELLFESLDLPKKFEQFNQPHIHELSYLAEDSSGSPMRIENHDIKSDDEFEIVDRALRVSLVRMYCLSLRAEHLARIILEKPLREPFLSSSVILLDQISVILKFIHTDWLKAYRKNIHLGTPKMKFDIHIFDQLNSNKLKNSKRKNTFDIIKSQDLLNSMGELKSDIALEYMLSSSLKQSMVEKLCENSKKRLDFSHLHEWSGLLDESTKLRYDRTEYMRFGDPNREQISPSEPENKVDAPVGLNGQKAEKAYTIIQEMTEREWILWARLVFTPTAFVGRVMVTANTPRDINREDNVEAIPLLSRKLREIINDENHSKGIAELIKENGNYNL